MQANKAGGTVDPVGTSLNEDFDGDGIANDKETNSNIWVADYPEIETEIAPPVTMKVEVLKTGTSETSDINSDITSDELESRKNEGSEKFHQNELNEKTVQYEKEASQSSSSSSSNSSSTSSASASTSASASGGGGMGFSASAEFEMTVNVNVNQTSTSEHTFNQSSSERTQVFEDRPFKNNLDRSGTSVKADAAAKNARQYRRDKQTKNTEQFQTTPNGGQVRAALFIKNNSVNMPVRISNILCSLLFESPQGQMIPVQSFRLRNDDFSLFEVEVYGGAEFGPYVVTLNNLNTVEIENAIALGYTPKIYIVDYQMTHVADSNYRAALSSTFTGNNLKIVEENAKGRTALIKIFAPNFRRMYRVAAFDVQRNDMAADEACNLSSTYATNPAKAPGISLRRALQRIACNGMPVEFEHYVLDFSGTALAPIRPTVYMYGIKGINNLRNNVRCVATQSGALNLPDSVTGDPGSKLTTTTGEVKACRIRVADLTEDEVFNMGMWVVFDNGKYFKSNKYLPDSNSSAQNPDNKIYLYSGASVETCGQPNQECATPVVPGAESKIWAGDNYDIVYMKISDLLNRVRNFGSNPLELATALKFNTAWDAAQVGPYPYYPNVKSTFLGQAGMGDRIELKVKLNDTRYLNPNFGPATNVLNVTQHTDFSYNLSPDSRLEKQKLFTIDEGVDMEISLGLNGTKSDWINIIRDVDQNTNSQSNTAYINCGRSWNFLQQEYTICLQLPRTIQGVAADGLLNVYMRTPLNNSYRSSIWPTPTSEVKRFDARLLGDVPAGATAIEVIAAQGTLNTTPANAEAGASISITPNLIGGGISGSDNNKVVSTVTQNSSIYVVTLSAKLNEDHAANDSVSSSAFTGMIKTAISGATGSSITSVTIIPTTGTLTTGDYTGQVSITLGSNGYYIKNVKKFENVYTVTLAAGTSYAHKAGERIAVSAGLTTAAYAVAYDNGFFTAWNQSHSPVFENLFEINQAFNCPNYLNAYSGIFRATHCNGYAANILTANWIGADSFAKSYENNWTDSRFLSVFANNYNMPYTLIGVNNLTWGLQSTATNSVQTTAPSQFAVNNDFLVSTSVANDQQAPQITVSGGRSLIVWYSNESGGSWNYRGRIVDTITGNTIGGSDFVINSTNISVPGQFSIVASGNRALVVMQVYLGGSAWWELRGRIIDLTTGSVLGTGDFLINPPGWTYQVFPKVVASGSRALVAWRSSYVDYGDIIGQMVDLNSGNLIGAVFAISTSNTNEQNIVQAAISGDKALIVWQSNDNGSNFDVRGRVVDLLSGASLGLGDFLISTTNGGDQGAQQLAIGGTRALVAWHSYDNGSNADIRGRVVDLLSGTPIGGSDFLISSTNINNQAEPQIAASGNRAIVSWESIDNGSNYDIRSRFVDLTAASVIGMGDFLVSSSNVGNQRFLDNYMISKTMISGNRAIIIWQSDENGSNFDIRGRILDVTNGVPLGSADFLVSSTTGNEQQQPQLAISNESVFAVWQSRDNASDWDIRAAKITLPDISVIVTAQIPVTGPLLYGANHFFTAPLIERNYTVTSRIKF